MAAKGKKGRANISPKNTALHRRKQQEQTPKNKRSGGGTINNARKPKLPVSTSGSGKNNKAKQPAGASKSNTTPRLQQKGQKVVSKNRQTGMQSVRKPKTSKQDNQQKGILKKRTPRTKTLSNLKKLKLLDQGSQTCEENNQNISSDAGASFMSTPASSLQNTRIRPNFLPPGTADLPHSISDSEMYMTKSTAVAPARMIPSTSSNRNEQKGETWLELNLEPLKIIHRVELHGDSFFMMAWKETDILDLVPTKFAKEKWPQQVIQFYESHLRNVYQST